MRVFCRLIQGSVLVFLLIGAANILAQGPPPPPPPRASQQRVAEIKAKLGAIPLVGSDQRELASFVREYVDDATKAIAAHHRFQAERFADAADACWRPIDHLHHIAEGPRGPKPPGDISDHLRQIYFRLRLCDFFLQQIPPPAPKRLLDLARVYYQRAQDVSNSATADEYAKAADDLTHALENLAQAYLPEASQ